MTKQRPRLGSKTSSKCPSCKKVVDDNDISAIGCESCVSWFHGNCVGLSIDDVQWLGTQRNCLWCCDACLDKGDSVLGASSNTEAKLNSLFDSLSTKVTTSISELIPKAIKDTVPLVLKENVKKAVADSIPSYSDVVGGNFSSEKMQFVITGSTESEDSYLKQIENDVDEVNKILNHMGLSGDGNISEIRRLGRSQNPSNKEKRTCRPLLITTSNPLFLKKCFARSHHLQTYENAVYIKKFLSSKERAIEKEILSKRYSMITQEGKSKEDFRIKNLKLYYKGNPVTLGNN